MLCFFCFLCLFWCWFVVVLVFFLLCLLSFCFYFVLFSFTFLFGFFVFTRRSDKSGNTNVNWSLFVFFIFIFIFIFFARVVCPQVEGAHVTRAWVLRAYYVLSLSVRASHVRVYYRALALCCVFYFPFLCFVMFFIYILRAFCVSAFCFVLFCFLFWIHLVLFQTLFTYEYAPHVCLHRVCLYVFYRKP